MPKYQVNYDRRGLFFIIPCWLDAGFEIVEAESLAKAFEKSEHNIVVTGGKWKVKSIHQVDDDIKPGDIRPLFVQEEIHRHQEAMVKNSPENIKVKFKGQELTYRQAAEMVTTLPDKEANDIISQVEKQNVWSAHLLGRLREGYQKMAKLSEPQTNSKDETQGADEQ